MASKQSLNIETNDQKSLLSSLDGYEMQSLDSSGKLNLFPDPRDLVSPENAELPATSGFEASPNLIRAIKKRFSGQVSLLHETSYRKQDGRRWRKKASDSGTNGDLLSERSPSQGGYDLDAKPLDIDDISVLSDSSVVFLHDRSVSEQHVLDTLRELSGEQNNEHQEGELLEDTLRCACENWK